MSDNRPQPDPHLSRVQTLWTTVRAASQGEATDAANAKEKLYERYGPAVYRYLRKVMRDPDAAEEVFSEFLVLIARGGFRHADPQKGRFRDYLKTTLINLIRHHRKQAAGRCESPAGDVADDQAQDPDLDSHRLDKQFVDDWRQQLLDRVWESLATMQLQSSQPLYDVLLLKSREPSLTSGQLAERLNSQGPASQQLTDAYVRKLLQRAREAFAERLIREVQATLASGSLEEVERELIDLGLHGYCRGAIATMRGNGGESAKDG